MGSKNSSAVDKWLTDEGLLLISCWARDFTLGEVAERIGISFKTFVEWRKKYPEIEKAVSEGKEVVDYKVECALLKSALGYTTKEVKTYIGYPDKNGNRKTRTEITEKEVAPNPTAIMCWLNNRKPEQWKRNRDILQTKDEDNKITVNIIRHGSDKDDEDWDVNATNSSKKSKAKKATAATGDDNIEYTDEELEWLEG